MSKRVVRGLKKQHFQPLPPIKKTQKFEQILTIPPHFSAKVPSKLSKRKWVKTTKLWLRRCLYTHAQKGSGRFKKQDLQQVPLMTQTPNPDETLTILRSTLA